MTKVPPFVPNSDDNMHCVNAVFRMIFQHFYHVDFTWGEIDRMTKAIPGKGVWTVLGEMALAKKGLKVTNIEPTDYTKLYQEGPLYLKKVYGEQTAKYYLEKSNVASVIPDIPEYLKWVRHETRRATVSEILDNLRQGKLLAAEIDSAVLNHQSGFALHFVLIYDFDGSNIIVHDPGLPPMPTRKVPVGQFEASFGYKGGSQGLDIFSL